MNEEPILITLEEIKHAIAAMKKGESPGADGLPVEILKAGGECVEQQLLKICNKAFSTEVAPADWQHRVIRRVPATTTEG